VTDTKAVNPSDLFRHQVAAEMGELRLRAIEAEIRANLLAQELATRPPAPATPADDSSSDRRED
jgi:hypothetical protein